MTWTVGVGSFMFLCHEYIHVSSKLLGFFLNREHLFPMNQDTVLTEFPNSFIQICY